MPPRRGTRIRDALSKFYKNQRELSRAELVGGKRERLRKLLI